MITIFHGDDIASSRKSYTSKRDENPNQVTLTGEDINIDQLTQSLQGDGLFFEKKYVFIEELFSKKRQGRELDLLIDYLNAHHERMHIYIWEGKELQKSLISKFSKIELKVFKFPQLIFSFLDSIKPGFGKNLVRLFNNTRAKVEDEIVLHMLIRQFRLLLAVNESEGTIDEISRLAPWQASKLSHQSDMFSKERLKELYSILFNLDTGNKTGGLQMPLCFAIDFFLLGI